MWQIIGQQRAVSLLEHGLAAGTLPHAYLFTGPEHVGKTTLALDLARALNCSANAGRPCGTCEACRKITARNHPDVQTIGLDRKDENTENKLISIEQIKDMQHDASLPPFEGRHKVFIIEQAELLSIEAANRLLKTLEEPTEGVTFILLTVNEGLLPATVVSRCQRLELTPVPPAVLAAALEERDIKPERAALLARLACGCPGWALAAIDDESLTETRDEALTTLIELMGAGCEEQFAWAGQVAGRFSQHRKAVYTMLGTWRDYWRDLMLVKLGRRDMITNIDRDDELATRAGSYTLGQIRNGIRSIEEAADRLRRNVNPRLALEVLMLDISAA